MNKLSRYGDYSPGKYGLPHMGEIIADYRERKGYTQDTFSIVVGKDKQSVVYWENQVYLADMDRRIFLCKVLSIPPGLLGLTWRSVIDEDNKLSPFYEDDFEQTAELLKENTYGVYEDYLSLAHTTSEKYTPAMAYRFYKHQQELEMLVKQAPQSEKDSWNDLLSRFYQHSTFIAQHHRKNNQALIYANNAVDLASSLELKDNELIGAALYRRARVHLVQQNHDMARTDIREALGKAERARGLLKGSSYLLAAEINAFYTEGNAKLTEQCRKWQDSAATILYKSGVEDDGTFLSFSLYAVHHERAKTLARFALFHTNDDELVNKLKHPHIHAHSATLKDAFKALEVAKNHIDLSRYTRLMDYKITESRVLLIGREFEESAKTAKKALQIACNIHSQKGIEEASRIYTILEALVPSNPYVRNLGIELGIY